MPPLGEEGRVLELEDGRKQGHGRPDWRGRGRDARETGTSQVQGWDDASAPPSPSSSPSGVLGTAQNPPPSLRDVLEGKGPRRGFQQRSGRLLQAVAKTVGGGCCRLQMPLGLPAAVRRERAAGP